MKKSFQIKALVGFLVAFFAVTVAFAQAPAPKPQASPAAVAEGKIGNATVTINYSAPSVKGRKVFGELVPYNKGWRAGANQATTFTTSSDITVDGKKLAAGKYSLYMVPGETEWKIIFNSAIPSWGIGAGGVANDPTKDVLAVTVKPKKATATEQLKYVINPNGFSLVWDTVEVPVVIK